VFFKEPVVNEKSFSAPIVVNLGPYSMLIIFDSTYIKSPLE
jgi:hypothetical protein